ncbi:MAG: hypothetical protein H8E79_08580 [Desulfobulbaceae bacterium]|uniref:Uncharacterized protein n=1 Tax=Candidatus Desulfatifera sulfidica TaxID=2841691 RepID=A0A8J6N966_9BACT|nr:hypothetical protein [Candidatus Desulfatifera sulfidica]
MLIIKCAACRNKLWKYDKIGPGEVLRCHKDRIQKMFNHEIRGHKIHCPCGREIGIDKGSCYKMIAKSFTYRGSKRNS